MRRHGLRCQVIEGFSRANPRTDPHTITSLEDILCLTSTLYATSAFQRQGRGGAADAVRIGCAPQLSFCPSSSLTSIPASIRRQQASNIGWAYLVLVHTIIEELPIRHPLLIQYTTLVIFYDTLTTSSIIDKYCYSQS